MMWFWIGLGVGVLLTVPLVMVAARREGRRARVLAERARSAERLAELGTLTGGLAHEIKNPLSTLGGNVQLIEEDLDELIGVLGGEGEAVEKLGRVRRRFEVLTGETDRLRDILEDFLRFAGRVKLDVEPVDLNDLVGELVDFFHPQAQAARVQVRTQLGASPARVEADSNLLKQALLNLLINATQAMTSGREGGGPSGGNDELLVRTETVRGVGGREVRVHVTDTGAGLSAEEVEKVMRPYYTTKKRGTGLGLPTARRIVEEHGGALTVHSELGRGTEFTLSLPLKG